MGGAEEAACMDDGRLFLRAKDMGTICTFLGQEEGMADP